MSDIAVVRDFPVSTDYARVNGKPVVLVSIQKTSSSNAVAVVRNVKNLVGTTKLPAGYEVSYSNDTTAPIQASLGSTSREILTSFGHKGRKGKSVTTPSPKRDGFSGNA